VCLGQGMQDLNLTVDGVDQTIELEVYLGQRFNFDSMHSRPNNPGGKCAWGEGHKI
jgi:hypothetical protein